MRRYGRRCSPPASAWPGCCAPAAAAGTPCRCCASPSRKAPRDGGANNFAVQLELGELLADTGQTREAVEALEQAFLETRKSFGPEAVLVCSRLADLLQESGNHIQACEVLKHALDLMETGPGGRFT